MFCAKWFGFLGNLQKKDFIAIFDELWFLNMYELVFQLQHVQEYFN